MNCSRSIHWSVLLAAMVFALVRGCSSATITNTWRDPNFVGTIAFKKIAVLVIHPDGALRASPLKMKW